VDAPKQGENVCNFDDMPTTHWTITYQDGTIQEMAARTARRAEFEYLLEKDSAPLFEDALRKVGIASDSSSPLTGNMKARFRYFVTDRGVYKNEFGILMGVTLSIKDATGPLSERTYIWAEAEEYTSGWVTFPGSGTLNSLFSKALDRIVSQIGEDGELRSSVSAGRKQ
jgi:hypothetical protein